MSTRTYEADVARSTVALARAIIRLDVASATRRQAYAAAREHIKAHIAALRDLNERIARTSDPGTRAGLQAKRRLASEEASDRLVSLLANINQAKREVHAAIKEGDKACRRLRAAKLAYRTH